MRISHIKKEKHQATNQLQIDPTSYKLYSNNPEKNILTTSSLTLSTTVCHARGLVVVHSRKLSATLGGSTSTRPCVRKLMLKTCDFIDISNPTIPTTLGGSTTTSPPIVAAIL
jgi:hypothetical protein